MLKPSTSTFSATSSFRISSWTNCAPGSAAAPASCGCGWQSTHVRRFFPSSISVSARKTRLTQLSIPYDGSWPPFCLPLFTSDGLNVYFYALTAHFGHWLEVGRRGLKALRWQVATELIYGQVKKSYQRRKLVRVTPLMPLGTLADLQAPFPELRLSARLHTAF